MMQRAVRRLSTLPVTHEPIDGQIGRQIGRVYDLAGQKLTIDPNWLRLTLATHGALGFRRAPFTSPNDLVSFAKLLGQPMQVGSGSAAQLYIANGRKPPSSEPFPPQRGSDFWHSDNSYRVAPAGYTLLYLLEGAHESSTLLCDATHAYESLEPSLRERLLSEGLLAEHDSAHNAGEPVNNEEASLAARENNCTSRPVLSVHPLLRAHPFTGTPSLYVNPLYTKRLLRPQGIKPPLPFAEGPALLSDLLSHLLSESGGGCAAFQWRAAGDLLIVDNARMLHRATTLEMPRGSQRKMLRVSIAGGRPLAVLGSSQSDPR